MALCTVRRSKWLLYILECNDHTLYTGVTNDLVRRLRRHQSGKGARYTRGRLPVRLMYQECFPNRRTAMQREYAVKGLVRSEKWALIARGRKAPPHKASSKKREEK
jgi:putative endonuclease